MMQNSRRSIAHLNELKINQITICLQLYLLLDHFCYCHGDIDIRRAKDVVFIGQP